MKTDTCSFDEYILENELVPNHEIMSNSQIEKEFADIDFEIESLPRIKIDDPVVKYIGATAGDILRITRSSETAGDFVTYRIVGCAPRYEVMSDFEIEELKNSENLSKINIKNPFLRDLNVEDGDILKVSRGCQTDDTFVTYKIVEG